MFLALVQLNRSHVLANNFRSRKKEVDSIPSLITQDVPIAAQHKQITSPSYPPTSLFSALLHCTHSQTESPSLSAFAQWILSRAFCWPQNPLNLHTLILDYRKAGNTNMVDVHANNTVMIHDSNVCGCMNK